jgi:chromosome segregation ATPase
MLQKRFEPPYESEGESHPNGTATAAAMETTRSSASTPVSTKRADKGDDEKLSLFWRVFGGTILSIAALAFITLYNNLASSISDIRNDLSRERENRGNLAKKEELDSRTKMLFERIHEVDGHKADIEAIKERAMATSLANDTAKKDLNASIDGLKKETAGLEVLKERMAAIEGLKKDVAAIDSLKEKLATLTADLKLTRDEIQKAQQELEKNKASDLERKATHDSQARQLDETIKELQKSVQSCREKIARLEGSQPALPTPATKPKPGE